jgi:hypothetical protein
MIIFWAVVYAALRYFRYVNIDDYRKKTADWLEFMVLFCLILDILKLFNLV